MGDEKFDKLLQKADDAIRRNNAEYAVQLLDQVLTMQPDHPEGNKKFFLAVQKSFANKKVPKPSKLAALKLKTLGKKWDRLADAARKGYAKDPQNVALLQALAQALMELGHYHGSMETCRRWINIDANSATAYFWLAMSLKEIGQVSEALTYAQKASRLDSGKEISKFVRDVSAAKMMDESRIGKEGVGVLDIVADKEAAMKDIQSRRNLTGDEIDRRLIELKGQTDVKSVKEMADLLEKRGDLKNAILAYKKLAKLDPTNEDARLKAGDLTIKYWDRQIGAYRKAGDDAKVKAARAKKQEFQLTELARRVDAHPTDLAYKSEFATVLLAVGKHKEAVGQLQKCITDPKRKAGNLTMLGQAFLGLKQPKLALSQLADALTAVGSEMSERRKEVLYLMGHAHKLAGNDEQATNAWMEIYASDIEFRDVADLI